MNTNSEQQIIQDFALLPDWENKYEYLIQLGKDLPELDEQYHTEEYLVHGCQSKVWLRAYEDDGKIFFQADSDALITKGIVALLIALYSGRTAQEIADANLSLIEQIGLHQHLSAARSNGLQSMLHRMKQYASKQ